MLQRIRENVKGWGAWVIVLFLCVPFAFWGINQYFDPVADNAVAAVNGEQISSFQLDQAFQQRYQQILQMFGDDLPAGLINEQALRREELNRLIMQELLRQRTRELNLRASDQQLRDAIRAIPAFQQNGQFSAELYRQALLRAGHTPASFENLMRRDIALSQLQEGIAASAFATPLQTAMAVALENQGRRHAAVVVADEPFRAQVELSQEELQAYYEQNQDNYLTEETVDLAYVQLDLERFASEIEIDEAELRSLYEQRSADSAAQEERVVRHILIEGSDDAARARAEEALRRVQAGEDFAAVASEMSDDVASAAEGGSLGAIQRGMLTGAFEDALFAMNEGEVRGPVQTDFGFHVLKLDEIRSLGVESFESVREELADELRRQRARERFDQAVTQLADATFREDGSLQPAADELGIEVHEIENVTRRGGEGLAQNPDVRSAAFSETVLGEGRNSDPIYIGDSVVVIRVVGHQPAEPKPFETVEAEIRDRLTTERARELALQKANAVLERARNGESLADIAQAEKLIYRDESVTYRQTPDIGPAYAEALFAAEYPLEGPVFDVTAVENNDFVVFRLNEVIPGRMNEIAPRERQNRRRQLSDQHGNESITAYLGEMRANADVVVKDERSLSE
ncbi:MAG TPA: SurA N-terminal domain-containing protein [Gammaproteobacteria bacterium]|nr:SurA N-terminal domain-containing protein [Gammaproteobacteria bacterium]